MLLEMKAAGRVRYVGVTTSEGRRLRDIEQIMRAHPIDFVQVTYSLADRRVEERILPLARERNIAVIANRPFEQGDLLRVLAAPPAAAGGGRTAVHELGRVRAEVRGVAPRGDLRDSSHHQRGARARKHGRRLGYLARCGATQPDVDADPEAAVKPARRRAARRDSATPYERVVDLPPGELCAVLGAHLLPTDRGLQRRRVAAAVACAGRRRRRVGVAAARALGVARSCGVRDAGRRVVVGCLGLSAPAASRPSTGRPTTRPSLFAAQAVALLWVGVARGGVAFRRDASPTDPVAIAIIVCGAGRLPADRGGAGPPLARRPKCLR